MKNSIILALLMACLFPKTALCGPGDTLAVCGIFSLDSVSQVASRPTGLNDSISTLHFWIHYTSATSSPDSCSRTYAQSIANAAESSWTVQINAMQWRQPEPDLSDPTNGGDGRTDIYLHQFTLAGGRLAAGETRRGQHGAWIQMRNDLLSLNAFPMNILSDKTHMVSFTVAHEFNHLSQLAYNHSINWFSEATSQFVAQSVFQYDGDVFRAYCGTFEGPLYSTHETIAYNHGLSSYGNGLFCSLLAKWTGDQSVIKNIWNANTSFPYYIFAAISNVLSGTYHTTFREALRQYALWRYFTGSRADAFHFDDAGLYITSRDTSFSQYPLVVPAESIKSKLGGPGGCRFITFLPSGDSLTVTFDGANNHHWGASLIGFKAPSSSTVNDYPLDTIGAIGTLTVPWSGIQRYALVPYNLDVPSFGDSIQTTSLTYSFNASVSSGIFFSNRYHGAEAGGKLLLDNTDSVTSGQSRPLTPGSTHIVRTLQERFVADSSYKHHDWNGFSIQDSLAHSFIVQPGVPQIASA